MDRNALDPPAESVEAALARLYALDAEGEFIREVDEARRCTRLYPEDWRFKYRHVLALARVGALDHAFERYAAYDLQSAPSLDARTLYGRLLKEKALRAPNAPASRSPLLRRAAEAYEAAKAGFEEKTFYYPEDNAAQLYLLAGDLERARECARAVLRRLEALAADAADLRWRFASKLNALVVLGRLDEAIALTPDVAAAFASDWAGAATTVENLVRLAEHARFEASWIDVLRPPRIVVFSGHLARRPGEEDRFPPDETARVSASIREAIRTRRIGHAYGALAAGADILFAEALVSKGIRVTAVMPCAEEDFIAASVAPSGEGWMKRYAALRAREDIEIIYATAEPLMEEDSLFGYGARLAMGLAVLRAEHLHTDVEQIAVWDGAPARGPAGTGMDVVLWRAHARLDPRRKQEIIPLAARATPAGAEPASPSRKSTEGRRSVSAILFGDFVGFGKLRDAQVLNFVEAAFGAAARVFEAHAEDIQFRNTWGDGLYLVARDARAAASIAIGLQEEVGRINFKDRGLPELKLRIGGHLGPVCPSDDPVLRTQNFFGSQVSHAARIEPVAPPGTIFVTEPFAAALALEHPHEFQCDLVGTMELAKQEKATRIFTLRVGPGR